MSKSSKASRLEHMVESLRKSNHRITPQRLAVLDILADSHGHPSVEKIYEQVRVRFPTMSIATVYKTISMLKEINQVLELGFPDGSNRYDGNRPFPHPHVICTKCRSIIDPELDILNDLTQEVTRQTGFAITTHRLDFFGLCRACQEGQQEE
jgi:Fur family transcriptional regulator, peroxide stress response regulator